MLIDTHTHLYLPEFENDDGGAAAVERAIKTGVNHMIFPNVDLSTIEPMKRLHASFPDNTSIAMGFHPTEVNEGWHDSLTRIESELRTEQDGYKAVGEIGIDLYWDKTFEEQQMRTFEKQIEWAQELGLPIIIHCRDGLDQTLEVLSEFPDVKGVMHSFGGTAHDVERVLNVNENMMFGLNGIVTFKNSKVRESLPAITMSRLLLETDSPYLAPVPFRGKRCESAMIVYTAGHIASFLGITPEAVAAQTTRNARTLFNI